MATFTGSIRSEALQGNTWVQVLLPDGSTRADKPYPVVYLLHGTTGNSADWTRFTRLPLYALEHGVAVVIPEIGNTWAKNIPDRGRFFDYLVDELPDLMGGLFNFSRKREETAVMGASSGAYAALKCALSRPEQYGFCGAFSTASVFLREYLDDLRAQKPEEMENPHLRAVYGPNLTCSEEDVLPELAQKASQSPVRPGLYLTIGKQDFLYGPNQDFKKVLSALPLDFEMEEWEGGHDWYFWDESVKRALARFSKMLG